MIADTVVILGFLSSIAAAVIFGIYMIPQKYAGFNSFQFLVSMGIGVLLTTFPLGFLDWPLWSGTNRQIFLCYLCGFVWCTGTIGYIRGIRGLGLARATCVKNTTGIWGTLFGIVFLAEFSFARPLPLLYAFAGSACIVYATILLTLTRAAEQPADAGIDLAGLLGAFYAAVSFAAYMIPAKWVLAEGMPLAKFLFYKGQGAFAAMALAFLIAERGRWGEWLRASPRQHLWAISSGAVWTLGFWLIATGTMLVGLAVSWPLNQLSTHFAVLFGVLTKEFDMKKYTRHIIVGLAITTIGIVLLGLAKA